MTPPLLEARGLGRRGGDGWLLRGISLPLDPGQRLALLGPSGGGKTLLLRALALLDPLDEGSVHWLGEPVADADVPAYRTAVHYLSQRPPLFEGTVRQNLELPFSLRVHRDRAFDEAGVQGLLTTLGREPGFLDRPTAQFSGGEAQVVALVRALQLDPRVLLCDEPTSALDGDTARAAEGLVLDWWKGAEGRALVWVSHDHDQAGRMTDRRVHIAEGQLTEGGP